jgi:hypothetical protein
LYADFMDLREPDKVDSSQMSYKYDWRSVCAQSFPFFFLSFIYLLSCPTSTKSQSIIEKKTSQGAFHHKGHETCFGWLEEVWSGDGKKGRSLFGDTSTEQWLKAWTRESDNLD